MGARPLDGRAVDVVGKLAQAQQRAFRMPGSLLCADHACERVAQRRGHFARPGERVLQAGERDVARAHCQLVDRARGGRGDLGARRADAVRERGRLDDVGLGFGDAARRDQQAHEIAAQHERGMQVALQEHRDLLAERAMCEDQAVVAHPGLQQRMGEVHAGGITAEGRLELRFHRVERALVALGRHLVVAGDAHRQADVVPDAARLDAVVARQAQGLDVVLDGAHQVRGVGGEQAAGGGGAALEGRVAGERGLGQHGARQGQRIAGPGVGVQAAAEGERGIRHPCGLAGGQALVQALDDGTQQVGQLRARDDRQARLGPPEGLEECGVGNGRIHGHARGG